MLFGVCSGNSRDTPPPADGCGIPAVLSPDCSAIDAPYDTLGSAPTTRNASNRTNERNSMSSSAMYSISPRDAARQGLHTFGFVAPRRRAASALNRSYSWEGSVSETDFARASKKVIGFQGHVEHS